MAFCQDLEIGDFASCHLAHQSLTIKVPARQGEDEHITCAALVLLPLLTSLLLEQNELNNIDERKKGIDILGIWQ